MCSILSGRYMPGVNGGYFTACALIGFYRV